MNEKVDYKTVNRVCKSDKIFIGLKKTCFGCFRIEENVTKTVKQV